jgi:hypothetical protein
VSYITLEEAQTWAEQTKLTLGSLEDGLVTQVATQVLSRIALAYNVTGWTDNVTTPSLVRSVIAMLYVSWLYDRTYSEDEPDSNAWAVRLANMADALIEGITAGTIDITDDVATGTLQGTTASYYPTDASSAQEPTSLDPSLGPARFTMGHVF